MQKLRSNALRLWALLTALFLPVAAFAQSNTVGGATVDLSPMQTSMNNMIGLGGPIAGAIGAAVFGFVALLWIMKKVQTAKSPLGVIAVPPRRAGLPARPFVVSARSLPDASPNEH